MKLSQFAMGASRASGRGRRGPLRLIASTSLVILTILLWETRIDHHAFDCLLNQAHPYPGSSEPWWDQFDVVGIRAIPR